MLLAPPRLEMGAVEFGGSTLLAPPSLAIAASFTALSPITAASRGRTLSVTSGSGSTTNCVGSGGAGIGPIKVD